MSMQSTLEFGCHAGATALEAPPAGHILVVEDEADLRSFIAEHLTAQGFSVKEAWFAEQALASIAEERPQLVLLDIALPGINGLEILRRIRRDDPTINIIMMTGNQDVVLARSTIQLGAMDYVFKPFEMDRFDRAIAAGMGKPID
jgi:DNA-binding response OmpR family regulator